MNLYLSHPAVLLARWTALLILGWAVHALLRNGHPRWRLILWRSIFCFSLLMPLAQFPLVKIPLKTNSRDWANVLSAPAMPALPSHGGSSAISTVFAASLSASPKTVTSASKTFAPRRLPLKALLFLTWGFGALWAGARLIRLHLRLHCLRAQSRPADETLQKQAREIAADMGVSRPVAVRISGTTTSPFATGFWKPAVLLPEKLIAGLPDEEVTVLMTHEIAHFRRHDLFWCVGWRWLQAVCWPHPLIWAVPAAHGLACEEEADRVASGLLEDRGQYSQSLARLALRVLDLPKLETHLALNAASHLARRLHQLKKTPAKIWVWKHSAAAFGLAGSLFLATAAFGFSYEEPPPLDSKEVLVTVQDDNGNPLADASIRPTGFRVQGRHHADAYTWNTNLFGAPKIVVTGSGGQAYVSYPVEGIPDEKELTGSLILSISHPGFSAAFLQDYPVDSENEPIRLARSVSVDVAAWFGAENQPVTELVPDVTQEVAPTDWKKAENGHYISDSLTPGDHLLQLMGRLPSGEIVYSDSILFTAEAGKPCQLKLEMKPGIRVEGQLDYNVPRPVKNGRVLIAVRPKEFPAWLVPEDFGDLATKYGYPHFWRTYRPINEDGTFVFESVPPGELDVIVLGDGFVSRSIGQAQNRINGQLGDGLVIGIPQPFALNGPVTKITVQTEPTATLDFTATTQSGKPIEGVAVSLNPNVLRIGGIFGDLRHSSEEPFRQMDPLPRLPFLGAKTGKDGKVEIIDIPSITRGMETFDSQYQVPLQDPAGFRNRYVHMQFSPGVTNTLRMVMEPKGTDFIQGAD